MYKVNVDGYELPQLWAGHPALEFCNTFAGWVHQSDQRGPAAIPGREYLVSYDHLVVWCGHVGLVDVPGRSRLRAEAERRPTEAAEALRRALAFRAALYSLLLDPHDTVALRKVTPILQQANVVTEPRLRADGTMSRVLPDSIGLELPLLAVARAAEQLLSDPVRAHVYACPGHRCGWLFLDPRGLRRWCNMATCGNRAKARALAERRRAGRRAGPENG